MGRVGFCGVSGMDGRMMLGMRTARLSSRSRPLLSRHLHTSVKAPSWRLFKLRRAFRSASCGLLPAFSYRWKRERGQGEGE